MLSAIQSWIKSKKRKNRRSAVRRERGRTLRVESLERRELLAADMAGVVRGADQYLLDTNGDPAVEIDRAYGLKNDMHVVGNWQGKGDFPGVVRAGHPDGLLRWYLDTNGDRVHDIEIAFGLPGDIPVVGDWNGDGRDDVGVVRRGGDGLLRWYLDTDGDPNHEMEYVFGLPGDIPVTGDWNGDGRTDVGVVRRGGDGLLHWYLNTDTDPAHEDHYVFGRPGDIPVTGDWNGDGRDDVGVVRADAKGFLNWYLNTDRDPEHEHTFIFGRTGDKPITGIWKMPEVTVAGGDLDASGVLTFGTIEVGQSEPTRRIVLRNDGTTNLALSVAKVPSGFTVVTGLPSSLRPKRTATLVLRMESTRVARFNDQLRIATNDGNETTLAFAVKGEVLTNQSAVSVAWRVPDGRWVNLRDGGSVSLPTVVQGQGDGQIRIRITNTGGGTLQPSNLRVPAGFVHLGGTLQPATRGQSQQITIGLNTSTLGTRTGRLSFATNDAQVGRFDIVLKGTVDAAVPRASVSYIVDCPNSVSRGKRSYIDDSGVISAWKVGQAVVFQIQNTGNASMTVGRITVTGGYLVAAQPTKSRLAVNESTTFELKRVSGDGDGQVRFQTNGVADGTFDFRIENRSPEIAVSVDGRAFESGQMLDFGTVLQGHTSPRIAVTIRNLGNTALVLSQPNAPSGFQVSRLAKTTLSRYETVSFEITMKTDVPGPKSGMITIRTNDTDQQQFLVNVRGAVQAVTTPKPPTNPPANPPIDVPGGTVVHTTFVDSGDRRVWVAQVQMPGAEGNRMRIYATVVNRTTGIPDRKNIPLSDSAPFGDHYAPVVAVTSTGNVVVAWNYTGLGANKRIYFRIIDPKAATTITDMRQANGSDSNTDDIRNAGIRTKDDGTFSILWTNYTRLGTRWAADFQFNGVKIKYDYLV